MLILIGWMEYSSQVEIEFLEIITETGSITLTGSHNVFYYKDGKATPTYAENLRPGNIIVAGSGEVKGASTNLAPLYRASISILRPEIPSNLVSNKSSNLISRDIPGK